MYYLIGPNPTSPQPAKQSAPTKDPAARAREALQRDIEHYTAYREGRREKLKGSHSEAYNAYEKKSAEKRAEIAKKAPHSIELAIFDKKGMEESRFVDFFCEYEPCPVLSFDDWIKAGKPKTEQQATNSFLLPSEELLGAVAIP